MYALKLIAFGLFWFGFVYVINCLIARNVKRFDPKIALVYFLSVALIGVFGEIALDTVYNVAVGRPLWRYQILPIHDGYTSYYAAVIWGIYGFHLCLLHDTFKKRNITATLHLALIFCFEALLLEAILTVSAKFLFGHFMYYYYPGDLWHVTSVQNIPFYFICGLIILRTVKRFRSDPFFFSAMSAALLSVVVFFV